MFNRAISKCFIIWCILISTRWMVIPILLVEKQEHGGIMETLVLRVTSRVVFCLRYEHTHVYTHTYTQQSHKHIHIHTHIAYRHIHTVSHRNTHARTHLHTLVHIHILAYIHSHKHEDIKGKKLCIILVQKFLIYEKFITILFNSFSSQTHLVTLTGQKESFIYLLLSRNS